MKNISKYIIAILIIVSIADQVGAQNIRKAQSDFSKLERYFQKVKDLAQKYNDERARNSLILAKVEIDKAKNYLYNSNPPRPTMAQLHMLKAKRYIDFAAKRVMAQPFKNLKAQLDNKIDQAEKTITKSRRDEANYLLNQAKKFRRLAINAYSESKILKGQEYFRIGFFFAQKCLEYSGSGGRPIAEQRLDLEMSVREMLNQAQSLNINNENINRLLLEAENHYQDALRLAEEGKEEMAVRRLKLIRRFLFRIYDQADRSKSSPKIRTENQLYSLYSFLQALESDIGSSMNNKMRSLYEKSMKLYREAEIEFENGNFKSAENKIALSQRFANKVFRLNRDTRSTNSENIESQLMETKRLLQLQKPQVENSENMFVINMHDEAIRIIDHAQREIDNGNFGTAFQLIQAATRMSSRVQREMRRKLNDISITSLETKYRQIEISLNRIESNESFQKKHNNIISQLKVFADRGKQLMDQGEYLLADEYFETTLGQIRQYTAKWRK